MATTTRQHIEMTRLDASGNQYILYPKNTLKDVYTSATSGVTIEGKVNFFGTCSTAAGTAAKTATISGFSLVAGAHVTMVFTNGISVASATLNINSTGAKAIKFGGAALKANAIRANARVEMVYDGTDFHVISGAAEAPYVTNANTTKFYLTGTPTNESGVPTAEHFDTGVYVSTTSGQLVAGSFSGDGASLTNLNASKLASGTVPVARLATSGATAGTYGPTADATLAHSGTVKVPQVTVDAYGRITGCKDITLTLPAGLATDEKVKNTLATTTKAYITGTTSATTNTGTQVFDTGVYLDTTAGRLTSGSMLTTTCYLGDTSSYINKTNYTGQAATVGTLSGYVVDSCASADANGVTAKALSANQGYLLQNQITTLNSNVPFKFGVDSSGNYGYIKAGADTVTPFLTRTGNATAANVLSGKTFSNDSSSGLTGTMPNIKSIDDAISSVYVVGGSSGDGIYARMNAGAHITNAGSGYPELFIPQSQLSSILTGTTASGQTRVSGTPVLTSTISFGKTFAIVPSVVIAYANGWSGSNEYDVTGWVTITNVTTTNFTVQIGKWTSYSYNHDISWSAVGFAPR